MTNRSRPSTATLGTRPVWACVIEDDPALRDLVAILLRDENINVEACPLGWNAHVCIRKTLPNVVILDVQMPSVDGLMLFHMLRGDPTTRSIPVIFLTANPETVRYELPHYKEMGAVLLPKPFDVHELLNLVRTAVAA